MAGFNNSGPERGDFDSHSEHFDSFLGDLSESDRSFINEAIDSEAEEYTSLLQEAESKEAKKQIMRYVLIIGYTEKDITRMSTVTKMMKATLTTLSTTPSTAASMASAAIEKFEGDMKTSKELVNSTRALMGLPPKYPI